MSEVSRISIASCLVRWTFHLFTRALERLSHLVSLFRAFFNQLSITSTGVFADGPGAYLFHGVVEQQYIFHVMDYALCLTESKQKSCVKHEDRGEPNPRSMAGPRSLAALSLIRFDYCAPVWDGLSSYLCEKLQKLQNRAARVILQANCEINSSLLLETLKWDKLSSRRRKQKAIMMFKSLNGLAPVYLQDLFSERNTDYNLRDAFRKLNLPKPRTDYLKRSFGYSGALLWNSLPENIRAIRSIGQFKKEINRALKTSDSHSAIL